MNVPWQPPSNRGTSRASFCFGLFSSACTMAVPQNCSPCVELKQTVSKVADLYTEENHLQIIAINIDRNRGLAHRFDLKDMPALIMFETVDGEFKNERYEGGRSETDVIDYINKKGGFNATPTKKSHKTGLVPEVHEDLKGFASASANERAAMAAKARDTVQDLNDQDKMSLFEKYVTVMKSVQQHGVDWISEEFGRLKELLENHAASLTDDKQVEFAGRINVLSFFKEDL